MYSSKQGQVERVGGITVIEPIIRRFHVMLKGVFFRMVSPRNNRMGSFLDLVCRQALQKPLGVFLI